MVTWKLLEVYLNNATSGSGGNSNTRAISNNRQTGVLQQQTTENRGAKVLLTSIHENPLSLQQHILLNSHFHNATSGLSGNSNTRAISNNHQTGVLQQQTTEKRGAKVLLTSTHETSYRWLSCWIPIPTMQPEQQHQDYLAVDNYWDGWRLDLVIHQF